jgi:hypothetical protein
VGRRAAALGAFGRKPGWERFDPSGLTTPFGPVGDALIAPAARWDAVWFLSVAGAGYDDGARAAFFPLYPALTWAAGGPFGSRALGALVVAGAGAVVALACVHRLAAIELGPRYARPAVLVCAFFPTSLFLTAMYSESVFLASRPAPSSPPGASRGSWPGCSARSRPRPAASGCCS